MRTDIATMSRVEAAVLQFFSPGGLVAVVIMIMLSVLLLGGSGIEHRMHDQSVVEPQQIVSPLMATQR